MDGAYIGSVDYGSVPKFGGKLLQGVSIETAKFERSPIFLKNFNF